MPINTGSFPKSLGGGKMKKAKTMSQVMKADKKADKMMTPAQMRADIKADKKQLAQKVKKAGRK